MLKSHKILSVRNFLLLFLGIASLSFYLINNEVKNKLAVNFNGDAQIEVGNHYMGVEFHHSSPLLQRISFYYPVANSIDFSTDYWRRDTTCIMHLGLKIDDDKTELIGLNPFKLNLTPYYAVFQKEDAEKSIKISYNFCNSKPAMIVSYNITNLKKRKESFEFYTHLETSVKTCHTYALKDTAETKAEDNGNDIYTNFEDPQTQYAQVFVANAGLKPSDCNSKGYLNSSLNSTENYFQKNIRQEKREGIPGASFLYKEELKPGQTMKIVQIIGSCKQNEGGKIVEYLKKNYEDEIEKYKDYVLNYVNSFPFASGDKELNHSIDWARAILAVNQHYIDGKIEPMPCPAEYNFYFTHDVLLTDLAAVNFDLSRVKQDLQFIVNHADNNLIIPHAFYWKDDKYVTEYADVNNWNNFWFIITSSQYLNHSGDTSFVSKIYPYISKCLEQGLTDKKDNLIWAYRPDWWDIGHVFGARAYMTILAIRAIQEYIYTSYTLHKNLNKLEYYENAAAAMTKALNDKLWDKNEKFLINYYNKDQLDKHYYMGSLLSEVYNLLDDNRGEQLINTVDKKLLDPKLGIYAVYPMDFNKLIDKWHFAGNEAGDPFMYINGGIWNHANAWYAECLMNLGEREKAYNFIKKTMTIDGIMNGPNGQPAMCEYRIGDFKNPKIYGKIDKPQFMWAAGWYLNSLYHLYGLNESVWNLSFTPFLPNGVEEAHFDIYWNGDKINLQVKGKGKFIQSIRYNHSDYSSAVIPEKFPNLKSVEFILGNPQYPYLSQTNSGLIAAKYDTYKRELLLSLSAFKGHLTRSAVISPFKPKSVKVAGKDQVNAWTVNKIGKIYKIEIKDLQNGNDEKIEIYF
jgi:Glycosyl hydrolase 36 superfamily, catalytic domain